MIQTKRVSLSFALALVLAAPIAAQDADESVLDQFEQAKPQVRPTYDSPASLELRDAVRRMALRPTDPVALTDAGHASLKLGDAAAALNFFTRANSIQPGNARTIAGMGSAMVRTENPFEALRYFDDAVRMGAAERSIALDRALAFDLLGNFARAHQDYQLAQSYGPSDDLTRRYAMSLSMAGMANEADSLLVPLLQRSDPEAWRARSMMLAARGNLKEAVQIAEGFLSPDAARRMEVFLRQMPRMTDAQRAAAMHFGHFPVGRIGEDSAEIRQVAAATGATKVASAATGQDRLIPSGQPLGASAKKAASKKEEKKPKERDQRVARNDAKPGFSTSTAQQKVEEAAKAKSVVLASAQLPPPDRARPPVRIILPGSSAPIVPPSTTQAAEPTRIALNSPVPNAPTAAASAPKNALEQAAQRQQQAASLTPLPPISTPPTSAQPETAAKTVQLAILPPATEASLAENVKVEADPTPIGPPVSTTNPAQPAPTPSAASVNLPATPAAPTIPPVRTASLDLDSIVQSIEIPESEQKRSVAPVDLKAIQKTQAKAETTKAAAATAKDPKTGKPKVEPKAPPQPARIWVQVATGAEAALGGDFRRFAKKSPELFKGKEGWTSVWGKSSRLLVGPFANANAAKKWDADYRKAGGSSFVWNSENGTIVKKLAAK
ncbi:MAG: hypothetical protein ACK4SJ_10380 [Sphingorhabdus sp.]